MALLQEPLKVWTTRLACEARKSFNGFSQRGLFVRCREKRMATLALMTDSPDARWKVSVPSSSVATCSGRFAASGRTTNGKADGVTIHRIIRQQSYSRNLRDRP